MNRLILLVIFLFVISCTKESESPQSEPSDGTANLVFHGRQFQFINLRLESPPNPDITRMDLSIQGTLDNEDNLLLIFKHLNTTNLSKTQLLDSTFLGVISDGDQLYGNYDLVENDKYEDYLSLDSLSTTKAYYSTQLNILDSSFKPINDTIWIKGTMEVNLP